MAASYREPPILDSEWQSLNFHRRPPGTLPLAGYGLWFLQPRHRLLQWFADMQPSMGLTTYELPVPSLPPTVLINDPQNLEYVLKDTQVFVKGDFFQSRSWDLFGGSPWLAVPQAPDRLTIISLSQRHFEC